MEMYFLLTRDFGESFKMYFRCVSFTIWNTPLYLIYSGFDPVEKLLNRIQYDQ